MIVKTWSIRKITDPDAEVYVIVQERGLRDEKQ